jgi:hypothetical protein
VSHSGWRLYSNNRAIGKETNDETRERVEAGLEISAASYAGYTENTIAKLKQAYKKKYYPR